MHTLRVLVVDDEVGMRLGVTRVLERFTVQVPEVEVDVAFALDQAESGEEALRKIEAAPPDILLLDHKLPGLSGIDVLKALAGRELDLLTVMITAFASLETAVTATKQGAFDFLAKPFTPAELKAAVGKAVKHLMLQRHARRLADEKRQVRFQFISVLAHELKSPLAAIEGYLYLLRDHAAGNDIAAYDRAVQRSLVRAEGMRKLIGDLLDLTRLESGQKKRELTLQDLREAAQSSIESVLPEANRRGITVTLDAPAPAMLTADRGELDIIFNNVVSNSVKYNRDGGSVTVAIRTEGEQLVIRVTDTGIGMAPEEVARLFGEFVRIKNDKTRNVLGSGLGLSILKKLAILYGGDVTVESTPDVGSTFTVVLRQAPGTGGAA